MRILVVDDEQSNLEEIEEIFYKTHLDVEGVFLKNPFAAMEAVKGEALDVAFLDIQMPGMTGIELAEKILEEKAGMEVVFITAYNHYAAEAFEVNAIDYILKPIRFERVEKTLKKLIERKKSSEPEQEFQALAIQGFGDARLLCGENEIRWNRGKTGELFWFLLMHKEERLHKEHICEALWPEFEMKQALSNLQVTLCRLRKDLACFERRQIFIDFVSDSYCLNIGEGYYDADEFIRQVEKGSREALEKAVQLYKGGFLEKKGWLWAENERERLRLKYERAVEGLAGFYMDSGDFNKAEILLSDYFKKEIPEEGICKMYLEVSLHRGHKPGLDKTYGMIEQIYQESLGIKMPAELKREYARLSGKI